MHYSSRLISNVRALFGCGRVFFACAFFALPFLTFSFGHIPRDLGLIYFKIPPVEVQGATPHTRPALLKNLRGEISVSGVTEEDEAFVLRIGILDHMTICVVAFLTCHWLWQLCRQVERGDIFNTTNLKLLRRLGALLIVEALAAQALDLWKLGAVATYVRERVSVTGLEVLAPRSGSLLFHPDAMNLNLTQIIIGLLVLCLCEVFRHGLKLQQESELTV